MARLITLNFLPQNTQLLLPTTVLGGVATPSIPLSNPYPFVFPNLARTISFTSTDDLSGTNFTIEGTDQFGNPISEIRDGPNNETLESNLEYNTITNISSDGAYTNFSIGSGNRGTFQWIKLNTFSSFGNVTIAADVVTGTEDPISYSLYTTLDKLEYYENAGSTYQYVHPASPILLGNNPLSTVTGSYIVVVTVPSTSGFRDNDVVKISDAEETNGITVDSINQRSMITVIDETHFSYEAAQMANATGTGGGSAVTYTLPNLPYRFPLKDGGGDPIELRNSSVLTQQIGIPAIQAVVSSTRIGTGFIVNILQQGIN